MPSVAGDFLSETFAIDDASAVQAAGENPVTCPCFDFECDQLPIHKGDASHTGDDGSGQCCCLVFDVDVYADITFDVVKHRHEQHAGCAFEETNKLRRTENRWHRRLSEVDRVPVFDRVVDLD